jgi:hypothetical protein
MGPFIQVRRLSRSSNAQVILIFVFDQDALCVGTAEMLVCRRVLIDYF